MAKRIARITMTEEWKQKISISQIINRLNKHINGEIEMTPTQVRSAEILLKKVAPDLSSVSGEMNVTHNYFDNLAKGEQSE